MEMSAWEHQKEVTPCGCQTLSKMDCRHVNGVYPKFLHRGDGAYVYDNEGNKYIDFPLGLGPILLGHNHPVVNRAIQNQLTLGACLSLPNPLEADVADKIINLIPSAQTVRFLKTGSEATSAAIKIARAFTGRDRIICCGYHGWHDWYNCTTPKSNGVPEVMKSLCKQAQYNNMLGFERHINTKTAAIILEPYVLDAPEDGFLQKVADLCQANGALLIFDEVVTGLRTPQGSAQKFFGITPDLTCLGKALGNGMPISAVCGRKEIMEVLEGDCFVSSTFGGELLSLAAANAVLDFAVKNQVWDAINDAGQTLKNTFNATCQKLGLDAHCKGYPNRTFFVFPTEEHKSLFWQECLYRGVLFGYAQFISYSHTPQVMDEACTVVRDSLEIVRQHWDDPKSALNGKVAQATFRLVAVK
jgi:glutamate-1-semialdehyde aminotransferase